MELTDQDFAQFSDFWHGLPRDLGDLLPGRSTINPMQIAKLLPFIFIFHARSEMMLEVRLCGTALDTISEQPMTGCNYLDICPENEKAAYWQILKVTMQQPCGLMVVRDVMFSGGKTNRLKTINFPLLDKEGKPTFLVGIMGSTRPWELLHKKPEGGRISSAILKVEVIDIGAGVPAILNGGAEGLQARVSSGF